MKTLKNKRRNYGCSRASGFLGSSLARYLSNSGHSIVLLSRRKPHKSVPGQFVPWDGRSIGDWCQILNGASGLVNLVGRSVDCIKTPNHCDEILRSRVESVNVLGAAMRTTSLRCKPPQAGHRKYERCSFAPKQAAETRSFARPSHVR